MRPSIPTEVLLDAVHALVVEGGFGALRMDAVAARAGVAKGVPYGRYPSKDDLLLAMIDREFTIAIKTSIDLVVADPDGGRFSRLWLHSSAALAAHPVLQLLYSDPASPLGRMADERRERLAGRAAVGAEFIRELQSADLVEPGIDPDTLAANLTLWNLALAGGVPGGDPHRLILGMADLIARAADTGRGDPEEGKAIYRRLAERLIDERTAS